MAAGVRKTVTVLFCDITGSTELGESVDPEALRALLARYFERMRGIVEHHGGTVEKFIGDAVMAVFGVPVAHEDDAFRAVRAAAEMREALPELGVQARIGVNTGEVVTGTEERLATGDAVNVAARLEQVAQPGEVLLGGETLRLVGDAVDCQPVEPLALKGKREPVPAFRLLAVHEAAERRHDALFVGREHELTILGEALQRVQVEQRCELVTVAADAGVGKTRLTAEFLAGIDAAVVRGRCLSYGEGITYWPVVEVVNQLDALPSDAAAATAIQSLLGETEAGTSAEEIAWAFRKLLEEQARERPLIVCFEDVHWGEETFLDLIEQIPLLSAAAPLLLLCTARPELVDRRPAWPVTLRLEPLAEDQVEQLIPESIAEELRLKIVQAAGGNPLFVWEMLAIATEAGGEVAVPPTLKALLAARLDQLDGAERRVLERGAVEGEIFHRGAVQTLAPEELQVTARLAALVRRELVRPERAQIPGEDGFRFRHLLIRDAAYDALPKAVRAELHERFATWLEQRGSELVELDEILGYHLEQAHRYRRELGLPDESALGAQAGERLAVAGRRARARGDLAATINLLGRALDLLPAESLEHELELGEALFYAGRPADGEKLLAGTATCAAARGDRAAELRALLMRTVIASHTDPEGKMAELLALAEEAIPVFVAAGDERGQMAAWQAIGDVEHSRAHWDARNEAYEQALSHATRAGDEQKMRELPGLLAPGYYLGPTPVEEALRWQERQHGLEQQFPVLMSTRACLEAMRGRFAEARALLSQARARSDELGQRTWSVVQSRDRWMVEMLAGDFAAAERESRWGCEMLEQMGEKNWLSTRAGELAQALCALGRFDEAEEWSRKSEALGASDDVVTQMLWRQVRAKVLARPGEHAEAERLAREAVALAEQTNTVSFHGDALMDLAEVLELTGRREEAATALEQALALYERKGNVVMAERARAQLTENPA